MDIDLTPKKPELLPAIVAINPAAAEELALTMAAREKAYRCPGQHRQAEIDDVARTVVCRACGFTLDPFEYLLEWAREGSNRMAGLANIKIQHRIAALEEADLMRRVKLLRKRLKNAGQPQTAVERDHYQSMRWNPHRVTELADPPAMMLQPSMPQNTDSAVAVRFTDWDEAEKHGPGAFIWSGDVGRLSLLMIVPGETSLRAIQVQKGPAPEAHVWGWDGNEDAPTLTPSIDALDLGPKGERLGSIWHGYLTAGRFVSC